MVNEPRPVVVNVVLSKFSTALPTVVGNLSLTTQFNSL